MSSILTNNSAMVALQTLKSVNASLGETQSAISTGKQVASAKDNAAIWSISKTMESDVAGFKGISESLSLGQSTATVGREAAESVTDLLKDMKEKIVSAQEKNVNREVLQDDIDAITSQIKSITGAAQFNGLNLVQGTDDVEILSSLDRSSDGSVKASSITVARQDLTASAGTFGNAAITGADLTGLAEVGDGTRNLQTAQTGVLAITGTIADTETITVNIAGSEFTVAAAGGSETAGTMVDKLVTAIGTNVPGITVANVSDELVITNSNELGDIDFSVSDTLTGSVAINSLNGSPASGVTGTIEDRTTTIDKSASAQTAAEAGKNATIGFQEGSGLGFQADDTINLSIGGSSFSLTLGGGETAGDIVDSLVQDINARSIAGITATNNSGQLEISNTNDFEGTDISISTNFADTTGNGGITSLNGAAQNKIGSGTIDQRAETLSFSATASVAEGMGFEIAAFGDSFRYVAGKGETMEDVARGLKIAIDSKQPDGVETRVQIDDETGQVSLAIGYDDPDGTTQETITLSASNGGVASGGLFGLDNIDVTSDEGATAALDTVETLIQNSIDAAASFGSSQGRIDTQSDFVNKLTDSLKSGIGSLVDADMEETSAKLQALQVQQQLATQALSIANQAPQSILSLFR